MNDKPHVGQPKPVYRDVYSGFELWLFLAAFIGAPIAMGLVLGIYL